MIIWIYFYLVAQAVERVARMGGGQAIWQVWLAALLAVNCSARPSQISDSDL